MQLIFVTSWIKTSEERAEFLQQNHNKLGFQVSNEHVNWHILASGLAIQTICNFVMKIPGISAELTLWSRVLASYIFQIYLHKMKLNIISWHFSQTNTNTVSKGAW